MYDILTKDLNYLVEDNPYSKKKRTFPYVMLTMKNVTRDMYKNAYRYIIKYKIDIFSNYNGEKEILDMEKAIFNHMGKLYDNDFVTYLRESQFIILDDKSMGESRKHGVITYDIYCTGGLEENDEQSGTTN